MPTRFVELLASNLGISHAEAERALDALGEIIRERLADEEHVRIDGLGTLRYQNDEVRFEPDESLERLVNVRYAGLPIVDVAPATPTAPIPDQRVTHDAGYEDPFALVSAGDDVHFDDRADGPLEEEPLRDINSDEPPATRTTAYDSFDQVDDVDDVEETDEVEDVHSQEAAMSEDEESFDLEAEAEPVDPFATAQLERPEPAEEFSEEREEPVAPVDHDVDLDSPVAAVEDESTDTGPPRRDESAGVAAGSDEDDIEEILAGMWTPRMGPEKEEHPLGPLPRELLEDADFKVVGPEKSARDQREHPEPPVSPTPGVSAADAAPDRPHMPGPSAATDRAEISPRRQGSPRFDSIHDEREGDSRKRPLWPIALVTALMLLATGGLVYYALWVHPDEPEPIAEVTPPVVETPTDPGVAPVEEGPAEAPEAEALPDSPLMSSDGVDPEQGGFTWVISEPSGAEAQRRATEYRQQGYRVSVLPTTIRGTTFHRIAIGQFSTRAEAERHRDQLPRNVPPDIWILDL